MAKDVLQLPYQQLSGENDSPFNAEGEAPRLGSPVSVPGLAELLANPVPLKKGTANDYLRKVLRKVLSFEADPDVKVRQCDCKAIIMAAPRLRYLKCPCYTETELL